MADVHAGFDTRLSRPVAIKLLRSDLARDAVFLTRFRREAQSAAGLNHPNIVAIFDSGEDDNVDPTTGVTVHVPYIVMEVVDGRTLREHLTATGPMPAYEAGRIVSDVLAALDYSHSKGIVHRDIKPANIMLGRGGAVKVMDFGIARAITDSAATMTQTQSVVGTAQYFSPEQAQGKPVDARSDLYSTGCMLFELLTGRTPFVGESAVSIAYQHVGEPATPPSSIRSAVPAAYDAITLHAMVKDRDSRYQTALEFRDDLLAAGEGRAISAAARGTATTGTGGFRVGGSVGETGDAAATTVLTGLDGSGNGSGMPLQDAGFDDHDDGPLTRAGRRAQDPPKRRGAAYVLLTLAALAALAVLFILGRSILAQNAKPEQVAVPYLINQTEEQARSLLTARHLVIDARNVTNATVAKGLVIDQDPDSETMVSVGSTVTVSVSSGPGQAAVPAVAGLTKDAALTALKILNFTAVNVVVLDDPSQAKDAAIGTDPPAGTVIPLTQQITVRIASGKVAVPALVNQNQVTAQATLSGLKLVFAIGERVPTPDTTVLEGTVLSQDIAPGTLVDVGSTVKVKIAIRVASTVTITTTPPPATTTSTSTSTATTGG
jgi:serine/threonine-protein kinase